SLCCVGTFALPLFWACSCSVKPMLISVSRIVFISVGPARPKMPFIKSGKRRQGKKCADTDFQKIVAQYGTTEVLDPGGTAFSEPTLISLASGFETATKVRAHNLPRSPQPRHRPISKAPREPGGIILSQRRRRRRKSHNNM